MEVTKSRKDVTFFFLWEVNTPYEHLSHWKNKWHLSEACYVAAKRWVCGDKNQTFNRP